jgi:hypothetical protein
MAGQAECAFAPNHNSYPVMPSGGPEELSRPIVHFEGPLNTFGWLLQCADSVVRHVVFASSILMEWPEIHRRVISCSWLEDLGLLDSV